MFVSKHPASFDLPRYLSLQPLFSGLSEADLQRIAADGCALLRLVRGEPLPQVCPQGSECFHIVVTGQLKLFALASNGGEKVMELVGPGQSVGETLMFNEQAHQVNGQALTDVLLLRIPKAAITAQISRDPAFALRLLDHASQRIQSLQRDVESYCLHSGVQRVAGFLLGRHAPPQPGAGLPHTVSLPVSKATIASRLSLTPEYFSRVLRELEDEGLIAISRRDIRILRPQSLASYTLQ